MTLLWRTDREEVRFPAASGQVARGDGPSDAPCEAL